MNYGPTVRHSQTLINDGPKVGLRDSQTLVNYGSTVRNSQTLINYGPKVRDYQTLMHYGPKVLGYQTLVNYGPKVRCSLMHYGPNVRIGFVQSNNLKRISVKVFSVYAIAISAPMHSALIEKQCIVKRYIAARCY